MKYKVKYMFVGEIILEADGILDAISCFEDHVGFSGDDLYENLNHNALITDIEKYEE